MLTRKSVIFNLQNLHQIVFEVTDACNLRCKYCGYAELYGGYDKRDDKQLSFAVAKRILDYLFDIWRLNRASGVTKPVSIGFYGGEPLLNMSFVESVVNYVNSQHDLGKKFIFNMTTNAMLLDRYADYLADHEFRLLISLDGDEKGQGYRVDVNGHNSFCRVFKNIKYLQERHPDYFEKLVMFNSVLHSKNSVESIYHFIKNTFGKEPSISPLNDSGIRPDKQEEFNRTYRNYNESIREAPNCEAFKDEIFIKEPNTRGVLEYLHYKSGNVFESYNALIFRPSKDYRQLTGTCTPFSKKMFITVNGKILQCERINHEFAVGTVTAESVDLDLDAVVAQHNRVTTKFEKQCAKCGYKGACTQCVYQIDNLLDDSTKCSNIVPTNFPEKLAQHNMLYLRKHPELYCKLLKEVVIRG